MGFTVQKEQKAELGYSWRRCGFHCAINRKQSQVTTGDVVGFTVQKKLKAKLGYSWRRCGFHCAINRKQN